MTVCALCLYILLVLFLVELLFMSSLVLAKKYLGNALNEILWSLWDESIGHTVSLVCFAANFIFCAKVSLFPQSQSRMLHY